LIGGYTITAPRTLAEISFTAQVVSLTVSGLRLLVADSVAKVPKAAGAKFPPKNETSDNRRSIEPQTRYQNRL